MVTVHEEISRVSAAMGCWAGRANPEVARKIAEDDEFGVLGES